ncbi:unnamed protein product [Closterium sp. NIES-54]
MVPGFSGPGASGKSAGCCHPAHSSHHNHSGHSHSNYGLSSNSNPQSSTADGSRKPNPLADRTNLTAQPAGKLGSEQRSAKIAQAHRNPQNQQHHHQSRQQHQHPHQHDQGAPIENPSPLANTSLATGTSNGTQTERKVRPSGRGFFGKLKYFFPVRGLVGKRSEPVNSGIPKPVAEQKGCVERGSTAASAASGLGANSGNADVGRWGPAEGADTARSRPPGCGIVRSVSLTVTGTSHNEYADTAGNPGETELADRAKRREYGWIRRRMSDISGIRGAGTGITGISGNCSRSISALGMPRLVAGMDLAVPAGLEALGVGRGGDLWDLEGVRGAGWEGGDGGSLCYGVGDDVDGDVRDDVGGCGFGDSNDWWSDGVEMERAFLESLRTGESLTGAADGSRLFVLSMMWRSPCHVASALCVSAEARLSVGDKSLPSRPLPCIFPPVNRFTPSLHPTLFLHLSLPNSLYVPLPVFSLFPHSFPLVHPSASSCSLPPPSLSLSPPLRPSPCQPSAPSLAWVAPLPMPDSSCLALPYSTCSCSSALPSQRAYACIVAAKAVAWVASLHLMEGALTRYNRAGEKHAMTRYKDQEEEGHAMTRYKDLGEEQQRLTRYKEHEGVQGAWIRYEDGEAGAGECSHAEAANRGLPRGGCGRTRERCREVVKGLGESEGRSMDHSGSGTCVCCCEKKGRLTGGARGEKRRVQERKQQGGMGMEEGESGVSCLGQWTMEGSVLHNGHARDDCNAMHGTHKPHGKHVLERQKDGIYRLGTYGLHIRNAGAAVAAREAGEARVKAPARGEEERVSAAAATVAAAELERCAARAGMDRLVLDWVFGPGESTRRWMADAGESTDGWDVRPGEDAGRWVADVEESTGGWVVEPRESGDKWMCSKRGEESLDGSPSFETCGNEFQEGGHSFAFESTQKQRSGKWMCSNHGKESLEGSPSFETSQNEFQEGGLGFETPEKETSEGTQRACGDGEDTFLLSGLNYGLDVIQRSHGDRRLSAALPSILEEGSDLTVETQGEFGPAGSVDAPCISEAGPWGVSAKWFQGGREGENSGSSMPDLTDIESSTNESAGVEGGVIHEGALAGRGMVEERGKREAEGRRVVEERREWVGEVREVVTAEGNEDFVTLGGFLASFEAVLAAGRNACGRAGVGEVMGTGDMERGEEGSGKEREGGGSEDKRGKVREGGEERDVGGNAVEGEGKVGEEGRAEEGRVERERGGAEVGGWEREGLDCEVFEDAASETGSGALTVFESALTWEGKGTDYEVSQEVVSQAEFRDSSASMTEEKEQQEQEQQQQGQKQQQQQQEQEQGQEQGRQLQQQQEAQETGQQQGQQQGRQQQQKQQRQQHRFSPISLMPQAWSPRLYPPEQQQQFQQQQQPQQQQKQQQQQLLLRQFQSQQQQIEGENAWVYGRQTERLSWDRWEREGAQESGESGWNVGEGVRESVGESSREGRMGLIKGGRYSSGAGSSRGCSSSESDRGRSSREGSSSSSRSSSSSSSGSSIVRSSGREGSARGSGERSGDGSIREGSLDVDARWGESESGKILNAYSAEHEDSDLTVLTLGRGGGQGGGGRQGKGTIHGNSQEDLGREKGDQETARRTGIGKQGEEEGEEAEMGREEGARGSEDGTSDWLRLGVAMSGCSKESQRTIDLMGSSCIHGSEDMEDMAMPRGTASASPRGRSQAWAHATCHHAHAGSPSPSSDLRLVARQQGQIEELRRLLGQQMEACHALAAALRLQHQERQHLGRQWEQGFGGLKETQEADLEETNLGESKSEEADGAEGEEGAEEAGGERGKGLRDSGGGGCEGAREWRDLDWDDELMQQSGELRGDITSLKDQVGWREREGWLRDRGGGGCEGSGQWRDLDWDDELMQQSGELRGDISSLKDQLNSCSPSHTPSLLLLSFCCLPFLLMLHLVPCMQLAQRANRIATLKQSLLHTMAQLKSRSPSLSLPCVSRAPLLVPCSQLAQRAYRIASLKHSLLHTMAQLKSRSPSPGPAFSLASLHFPSLPSPSQQPSTRLSPSPQLPSLHSPSRLPSSHRSPSPSPRHSPVLPSRPASSSHQAATVGHRSIREAS